jgi:hypothetical protein
MTVDGGVILYGMDEDKSTRVAIGVPKVPLSGQEERLRQIANSNIRPAPTFNVVAITEKMGDPDGAVAVIIPPSPLAPHEVDGRFPRRDGTVTSNLTEPEIERLYRLRRHGGGHVPLPKELLEIASALPGIEPGQERSVGQHVGLLRVAARLAGDTRHPADPWLANALSNVVRRADEWFAPKPAAGRPFVLQHLDSRGWQPDGVEGWAAGWAPSDAQSLYSDLTATAVLRYPSHLMLQITFPLACASEPATEYLDYDCAYERLVVRELRTALVSIGQWSREYEAAGTLSVVAQGAGFRDATPYWLTRARPAMDVENMVGAPHGIVAATPTAPIELVETPDAVARRLIDRWLAPFYRGPDLYPQMTT